MGTPMCYISAWEEEILVHGSLFWKAAATGTVAVPYCLQRKEKSAVHCILSCSILSWKNFQGLNLAYELPDESLCYLGLSYTSITRITVSTSMFYFCYILQLPRTSLWPSYYFEPNFEDSCHQKKNLPVTMKIISILEMTKQRPSKPMGKHKDRHCYSGKTLKSTLKCYTDT